MSEALSSSGSVLDHFLDYGFDVENLTNTTDTDATERPERIEQPRWVSPSYVDLMLEIGGSLVPKIRFDDIHTQGILGRGYTWTVHRGIWSDNGKKRLVALKFLNVDIDTDDTRHSTWARRTKDAFAAAESEIRILSHKTIRANQNIVTLLGISFQVHSIGSVGEILAFPVLVEEIAFLTPEGNPATLNEDLTTNPIGANPPLKVLFLLDIARGLRDLHQLNIVHADLKPSNILLFPHENGRAVAKISDFGFCQSVDEEDPAQGSTPYWAAPECLPEADENMKQWRSSTYRDLFSFGLLIWFVLFEEGPFGDEEHFDYATMVQEKLKDSMKEKIDRQLPLSYRFFSQDPGLLEGSWLPERKFKIMTEGTKQEVELELKSLNDHILNGSIEEQVRNSRKNWNGVVSFADGLASFQLMHFFLSFFLVKDPPLRVGLNFFIEMANSKLFHQIVMANFIGLSTRDHLWQTLFNPTMRRLVIDINDNVFLKGNYLHLVTKLCVVRLNRDHNMNKLSQEHKLSMSTHFPRPVLFRVENFQNVPPCVPCKILESLIAKAYSSPEKELGEVFLQVGACYWFGFGTAKSESDALQWLLKSAYAGEILAQRLILAYFTPNQLPQDVKYVKIVEWIWRNVSPAEVVSQESLESLRERGYQTIDLKKGLEEARTYILEVADLSVFNALHVEYKSFFEQDQQFAWRKPEYEATFKSSLALVAVSSGGASLWEQVDTAIRNEDLLSLRKLISRFPQLLAQESKRGSILHYAVLLSRQTVARMLVLEHHMDPSHCDALGLSAIALAICCRQDSTSNLADFVTQARAKLSDLNFPILLLLSIYTRAEREVMSYIGMMASILPVREAIERESMGERQKIDAQFLPIKEAIGSRFLDAAMVWAIWANNQHALYWLVENGGNVNKRFKDIHFLAPLHCASERMKPVLVSILLAGGALPNITASSARTPLHLACSLYQAPRAEYGKCSADVLGDSFFQDSGLCRLHDPPHFDSTWGLQVLGDDNTPEERKSCQRLVVQLLLHYGATVDARDSNGRTPLAYSIGTRAFHISEALLTRNPPADINSRNDLGLTPLGEACEIWECPERAQFCLKWGANVHLKDELGRTPLFIAAQSGNIELCRILIAAGADIDAVDIQNDHCLQASLLSQKWDCASYLLSVVEHYLPDGVVEILSSCDYEGLNCLGCCIFLRSVMPLDLSVKFLELYAGASLLDAANASGYTPLHLAVSFQSAEWVRVLLELGADPRVSDTIYGWTPTFLATFQPLRSSMKILKLIMDSDKYTEEPEDLMGWTAGSMTFWLQSTLFLEGLDPEYYEIADRMRSHTIPRAVAAWQRESERQKVHYRKESFWDLAARLLEQKGFLRWKIGTPAIQHPPFDIFTDPDNNYLRDSVSVDDESISDRSRHDTRVVPWGWKAYPDKPPGKIVWIYDANGRFRKTTFVHLLPRRQWRMWVMNDAGEFQNKSL